MSATGTSAYLVCAVIWAGREQTPLTVFFCRKQKTAVLSAFFFCGITVAVDVFHHCGELFFLNMSAFVFCLLAHNSPISERCMSCVERNNVISWTWGLAL